MYVYLYKGVKYFNLLKIQSVSQFHFMEKKNYNKIMLT